MPHTDTLQDALERSNVVKLWKQRVKALKEKGISQVKFCDDHDICRVQFDRHVSGKNLPSWVVINKVESALDSEGV